MYENQINWTAEFAYVVGLITTDGSLSKDGRHLVFVSKDEEQVKTFAKILKLECQISIKKGSYKPDEKYYMVQFSDVKLYRKLLDIGLMPNKTKVLGKLKIPDKFFADFLRGCLDGDGYTSAFYDQRWKNSYMLYLGFTSASKNHLLWIKETIWYFVNVRGNINFTGKSTYRLIFAKKSTLKLINFMYYQDGVPCLKRKKLKIQEELGIIRQD